MNRYIEKLAELARKDSRLILGLMSGTSLDGLDIALCRISGSGRGTSLQLENFVTVPYPQSFRTEISKVFSQPQVDFQLLCVLNAQIGRVHAQMVLETLKEWNVAPHEIDLLASHGQTVFHAPQSFHQLQGYPHATLQIGDGDHLAVQTGIITLSDFRQKHIAAGGEGAPLAVYGDYLLFSSSLENRFLLNLGGIANFTLLPADGNPDKMITTDVGPANTLIDAGCRKYLGCLFDEDGKIGAGGRLNEPLLKALLAHDFFKIPLPKSTGPELFNLTLLAEAQSASGTENLPAEDVIATLSHLTARTVAEAILSVEPADGPSVVYCSGGGANNPFIVSLLQHYLGKFPVKHLEELGVAGDAKEAVLFALLANESVTAKQPFFSSGIVPGISLGKISLPG